MRQITGAGEPSSRSSNYRYFFLAAFFFFAFFFAAMVHLLTSGLIAYKCMQLFFCTPKSSRTMLHVIRILFPKHDYDAWCANSKLPTKKNATFL